MELLGHRVKVTSFNESDLDLFIEIATSAVMMEHVREPAGTEEAKLDFDTRRQPFTINSEGWSGLGISKILSDEKIGNICIKMIDLDSRIAEIGYMIKEESQGKGFAREAVNLVKGYVLGTLEINKLIAIVSVNNTVSYKLLEKLGFTREGRLRQNTLINERYIDDYIYGLCRSDL